MKISICDKCKFFNHKEIIKLLDENFENINYEIGCNNMCGVGRNNIVLFVNNKPIIAKNKDELIKKIRDI
jgi:hypothetical protein